MLWPLILSGSLECPQTSVHGLFFSLLVGASVPWLSASKEGVISPSDHQRAGELFNEPNWTQQNQIVGAGGMESKLGYKELWLLPPQLLSVISFLLQLHPHKPTNKGKPKPKPVPLISWFHEVWNTPITEVNRDRCLEETAQGSGIRFDLSSVFRPFSLAHVSQGGVSPTSISPGSLGPWARCWDLGHCCIQQVPALHMSQSLPVQKLSAFLRTPLPLKNKEPWELLLM